MNIAVIMTCHNRKLLTLNCLRALLASTGTFTISVYLVDDGCVDGTVDDIRAEFKSVNIISGNGELYWSGGMRVAWSQCFSEEFDVYIWLNDDVILSQCALNILIDEYIRYTRNDIGDIIVVGRTVSSRSGQTTYGGLVRQRTFSKLRYRLLSEGETRCDTMNGNCVLVPRSVAMKVGNISSQFSHALGDIDYGLRARRAGVTIVECKTPIAELEMNFAAYAGIPRAQSLSDLWRVLTHPKGIPASEWLVFCASHGGVVWPLNFLARYLRVALKSLNFLAK